MKRSFAFFFLCAVLPAAASAQVVYSNDFEANTTGFTSSGSITTLNRVSLASDSAGPTSTNKSNWLGKVGENVVKSPSTTEEIRLDLAGLVAGKTYQVNFDLLIGASWDGAASGYGPDSWRLSADGTILVDTIFSNVDHLVNAGAYSPQRYTDQNYTNPNGPDVVRYTGADQSWTDRINGYFANEYAIYYFGHGAGNPVLTFVASGPTAQLVFSRAGATTDSADEYWALDNVSVVGVAAIPVPCVYAANAGWINLAPGTTSTPVKVGPTILSGNAYAENFGWISFGDGAPTNGTAYDNTSAGDFGVNVDNGGNLSGYAYAANVGWINFGWATPSDPNRPRVDLGTGATSGFAYSANLGWINLATVMFSGGTDAAPAFTTQPLSQTATVGNSVTFISGAIGTPAPTYQWRKNGVAIVGATGASYTIASPVTADAGSYTVVASNGVDTVTSSAATLTVNKATPLITWPNPAAVPQGTALSSTQLNATALVGGTFTYTPAQGAVLSPGTQNLSVIFVPTDTANYTNASAQCALIVLADSRIPLGFDVTGYLARYPDLAAIYGNDLLGAWLHYRNVGIYQGEVFDELFRVEEYLTLYPELFALFGDDLSGALLHWLTQGSIEGRLGRIPLEFSATGYFARNTDVALAVHNDPLLAWSHYWLYGIYEGRAYDDDLRVFEYLAINADLTAAFVNDWRQAALHWMRYGRTEGRLGRLPVIFSAPEYLTRNPDVAAAWGTNPTTDFLHFWLYGIDEGRTFDDLFRVDEYLALNPDLAAIFGTDRRGAFKHWVRYGRDEGRLGRNP